MKNIVIIGASSGIGRRVAEDFASMGMRVGIAARREDRLKDIKDRYPDNVVYKTIDVTRDDAAGRFYDLIEALGGMDVLLFATGVGFQNPELDITHEVATVQTNVVGFTRIVLAAYRYFRDTANEGPGRIAAITSVASTKGIGTAAAYSASKRFQRTYLEALEQLANRQQVNVRFTDVRPGFIRTPLLRADRTYPMIMDLDYAAPLIEAAILKGRRVATVDWRWSILTALWSCIPSRLWVRMQPTLSTAEPQPESQPESQPQIDNQPIPS